MKIDRKEVIYEKIFIATGFLFYNQRDGFGYRTPKRNRGNK